jgi:hypothetical protein
MYSSKAMAPYYHQKHYGCDLGIKQVSYDLPVNHENEKEWLTTLTM